MPYNSRLGGRFNVAKSLLQADCTLTCKDKNAKNKTETNIWGKMKKINARRRRRMKRMKCLSDSDLIVYMQKLLLDNKIETFEYYRIIALNRLIRMYEDEEN